ncbi:hypothetical protein BDV93DRAFT_553554 [Ceratobasidium sp. AG-I]|nr:hypothetical protein BDV93DRAFT_553554 [Ceratobasidium sp. AG-I]
MHYPRPLHAPREGSYVPQALAELCVSATPLKEPRLPHYLTSNNSRALILGWKVATHVIPAAFPRANAPTVPRLDPKNKMLPADPSATKQEKRARATAIVQYLQECRDTINCKGQPAGLSEKVLWNAVNRYYPSNERRPKGSRAITLVVTHAGGFHKETWETTLKHVLSHFDSKDNTPLFIEEIWSIDCVNHGDSAVINEDQLEDAFSWADHARDILNFLLYYLPETSCLGQEHELILPQLSEEVSAVRKERGFQARTVVGLGHSFGASSMLRGAICYSGLMSSLILVDPIVFPSYTPIGKHIHAQILGAAARRTHWPNREVARADLLKSPFVQPWDSRVLEDFLQYGLYEVDNGVRLKCSGFQQAVTITEKANLPCEIWELLPYFDKAVPIRWIMDGQEDASNTGGQEITQQAVWRRPENSSNIRFPGVGHLMVQEIPDVLGVEVAEFLIQTHGASGPHPSTIRAKL